MHLYYPFNYIHYVPDSKNQVLDLFCILQKAWSRDELNKYLLVSWRKNFKKQPQPNVKEVKTPSFTVSPYFHASFPWVPLVHLQKMPSWKKGTRNSVWQYSVHWLGMHTCQIIHQADIGTPALTKHVYYGICVTTNASSRVPHIHHVASHFHIFAHATPTSCNAFCSPTTLLPGWIPPGRVFLSTFFPPGGIWGLLFCGSGWISS